MKDITQLMYAAHSGRNNSRKGKISYLFTHINELKLQLMNITRDS